ncbi:MAG: putative lipid II flippase FtsW [Actinomycetota bacterium]
MAGKTVATKRRTVAAKRRSTGRAQHLRVVSEPTRRADAMHVARVNMLLLLVPAAVLTVLGLAMIMSAGSVSATQGYEGNAFWYFQRQGVYAIAGVIVLVLAVRLPHDVWRKLAVPMLLVLVPLMLVTFHPSVGTSLNGASRWIDLGPVTLQPAELMKLAMIAFAAAVLTKKWGKLDDPVHLLIPLAPVVFVVAVLVIMQRDLGTTLVICGSVIVLLFVAGVRARHLAVTVAVALAGTVFLIFGTTYRRTRFIDSFLNPWNDPGDAGFQLIQGLIAFGSGGWTGVGLGASRQKWDYLPNAHSDFIFAILGEELGLLGALFVLAMFALLLFAGIRIAIAAPDTFGRLLAAGITGWIGLQTIINLGAVTGLMPITGVPLPLLSFGGTALVVTLAAIGVLASVARASAQAAPQTARRGSPGATRTPARRTATSSVKDSGARQRAPGRKAVR